MYKKFLLLGIFVFAFVPTATADEISFVAEIRGITVNGGTVYGAIYSNESSYKKHQPNLTFQSNSTDENISFDLQIPSGEYVIEVYQDSNNNGRLDFGLFNIPKEPIGITNYNGRGIPGNFSKLKVSINNGTIIIIQMYKL